MANTPNLDMPQIEGDQAQKHVTHNEALMLLDAVVQLSVLSRSLTEPSTSPDPVDGDRWIVPSLGVSPEVHEDWTGANDKIIVLQDGIYVVIEPQVGWLAHVQDEDIYVRWDGAAWGQPLASVNNAQLADMPAATVKGRPSGAGTGVPSNLTAAQLNTILEIVSGTWTPVLTFTVPGNLNVVYSAQSGIWRRFGDLVMVFFNIATSTFTHTTASSQLRVTGLPFTVGAVAWRGLGSVEWAGITKAGYTDLSPSPIAADTYMFFGMSGSGQTLVNVAAPDMPTGGNVILRGMAMYIKA